MVTHIRLADIARGRSGDKGAHANVGVWTDSDDRYSLLLRQLTTDRVKEHFGQLCRGPVRRYELPSLRALNFVLEDALDGGGPVSLRTDAQGKTYALWLLEMVLPEDEVTDL